MPQAATVIDLQTYRQQQRERAERRMCRSMPAPRLVMPFWVVWVPVQVPVWRVA